MPPAIATAMFGAPSKAEESPFQEEGYRSSAYRAELQESMAFQPSEAAVPLRDYQVDAVQALLRKLNPKRPQLLQLATGGGKTRVANEVVASWALEHPGRPVAWVTKDWRLLAQAATDMARRHQLGPLTRLGGSGQALHPLAPDAGGAVVYSTIQTLQLRTESLVDISPSLLVWDEAHWGERGKARVILRAARATGIPVLGLTATPRVDTAYQVAFSRSFRELVEAGYLARPVISEAVTTGISWRPKLRPGFDDVDQSSLRELAENVERNRCIVRTYQANAPAYGQTILFACTIGHADQLALQLAQAGVAARAVHSRMSPGAIRATLEHFRRGAVTVLTTVDLLTHGIDIPATRTVVLARPTSSDVVFSQMVGRGARLDKASGKNSFNIVEFTDNTEIHADLFETAQQFFSGAGPACPSIAKRSSSSTAPTTRHGFDPHGSPTWIPDNADVPKDCRGLWYRQGQTFGVEIELTTADGSEPPTGPKWLKAAEGLRQALATALPGRVAPSVHADYQGSAGAKDSSLWNVERDNSAGWEVTSRILQNAEGFAEVVTACTALKEATAKLGLGIDHRTGLHVHIGWLGRDVAEVRRAIRLARLFEPAVATLVAPSRIADFDGTTYAVGEPNFFCRPVSTVFTRSRLARARTLSDIARLSDRVGARFVSFNVAPLAHLHTVEVRLHSGTLEPGRILPWLSLWMQVVWAASRWKRVDRTDDKLVITPTGDIVHLASRWLPDARLPQQRAFLQRLHDRRLEIAEGPWRAAPDLMGWRFFTRRWTDPTTVTPFGLPRPGHFRGREARPPGCLSFSP
jgi:superfamily II DNA or RNA helicase